MARKKTPGLTDAELRLMEVVWAKGAVTVAEAVEGLPKTVNLSYSTVLTTLRILENKGYLRHSKEGRAFVYRPAVGRDKAQENAVRLLLRRFFAGSPEALVLNLIENKQVDRRELARLRRRIEEAQS